MTSYVCQVRDHRDKWFVQDRKCNYSAFNGYHRTPSDYSQVWCPICYRVWRTKAAYVDSLPDGDITSLDRSTVFQNEGERLEMGK